MGSSNDAVASADRRGRARPYAIAPEGLVTPAAASAGDQYCQFEEILKLNLVLRGDTPSSSNGATVLCCAPPLGAGLRGGPGVKTQHTLLPIAAAIFVFMLGVERSE